MILDEDIPIGAAQEPVVPEEVLPPHPVPRAFEFVSRQVKIRRDVELRLYGYSEGCGGCEAAKAGTIPRNHSMACRSRIEEAIAQSNFERYETIRAVRAARGEDPDGPAAALEQSQRQLERAIGPC